MINVFLDWKVFAIYKLKKIYKNVNEIIIIAEWQEQDVKFCRICSKNDQGHL